MTPENKKIRIVFVLNDFIIGGVQRLYVELFKNLPKDSYEMHLVTLMDLPGRADMYHLIPSHVMVHRLTFRNLFDVRGWISYARLMRRLKPDFVFATLLFSTIVVRLSGLFARYPIVVGEQNVNNWKSPAQILLDRLLQKRSARVVVPSKSVAEFVTAQSRVSKKKITLIPNPIDFERCAQEMAQTDKVELRREFGFSEDHKVVINVARLTKQKNHPTLIRAFGLFIKEYPNHRLLILGEGVERAALQSLIVAEGLKDTVVLAGSRNDVFSCLSTASFSAHTSFIEGFGIAHAEALVAGLPLLSTKTAGPDEMILEGKNGAFVEPTVGSVYEGLVRMARDGVSYTSEQIRESVRRFDTKEVARQYDVLFEEVIQK